MKLIVLLFLAFFTLSCRSNKEDHGFALLVVKTQDNPFFRDIENGVRSVWGRASGGMELRVRAGRNEGDVATQMQVLGEAIRSSNRVRQEGRLRAILITPASSGAELVPLLTEARRAGIVVVTIDTEIPERSWTMSTSTRPPFIGSSNRDGGQQAAVSLSRILPARSTVLLLNGVDGQASAVERRAGFLEHKPQTWNLIERTCSWRRGEARVAVDSLASSGTHFDAIFAANDEMALGAAEAMRERPRIPIIGFDATSEARDMVQRGILYATMAQDPQLMGRRAAETTLSLIHGQTVEQHQLLPVSPVIRNAQSADH